MLYCGKIFTMVPMLFLFGLHRCSITQSVYRHRKHVNVPPHDKTSKMTCAPSGDSDQPGHPPSLIRAFAVRMKKSWVLNYPLNAQQRL